VRDLSLNGSKKRALVGVWLGAGLKSEWKQEKGFGWGVIRCGT